MTLIAPSILAADFARMRAEVSAIDDAGADGPRGAGPPSARPVAEAGHGGQVRAVHADSYGDDGVNNLHAARRREGAAIGHDDIGPPAFTQPETAPRKRVPSGWFDGVRSEGGCGGWVGTGMMRAMSPVSRGRKKKPGHATRSRSSRRSTSPFAPVLAHAERLLDEKSMLVAEQWASHLLG